MRKYIFLTVALVLFSIFCGAALYAAQYEPPAPPIKEMAEPVPQDAKINKLRPVGEIKALMKPSDIKPEFRSAPAPFKLYSISAPLEKMKPVYFNVKNLTTPKPFNPAILKLSSGEELQSKKINNITIMSSKYMNFSESAAPHIPEEKEPDFANAQAIKNIKTSVPFTRKKGK